MCWTVPTATGTWLPLLTLAIAGACAGATGQAGAKEGPVGDAATILDELDRHGDVTVEITTGIEHFAKGLARLTVGGNGHVDVVNLRSGTRLDFPSHLDPTAVRDLGHELAVAGFTRLEPRPGPREPGDSPVVLRLLQGTTALVEKHLWYADRYDDKGLEKVLARYEALVSTVTGGQLPY